MARKRTKVSRRMLFTWFMLTGFIFLFAPQNFTSKFQLAFVHVFRWPLTIGGNLVMTAQTQQPLAGAASRSDTQYLNYIANLEETLAQERKRFKKLSGLYNTYNTHVWEGTDFALADVITKAVEGSGNELTIACRKTTGLAKGQFVLGDECIIGTISDVFPQISKATVKLVTDPMSKIPVKIAEFKNIMKGTGNNSAKIEMVKNKVEVGQNVFAFKEPGFLDAPMIVGKVSECNRNQKNPSLWDITVVPACDIEQLEDVAVIIMNPQK
ncbi:MAG: rod shape-determining protein MreC [Sedimentisphaerales bacterium]